jgi:hypothetical protein
MAETTNGQDIIHKLTERGEEVLQALNKLADSPPGSAKVAETMRGFRSRMDDVQKKLLGIDALEKKVAKLEKRLAVLEGKPPKPAPTPRAAAKARTTAKKPTTAKRAAPKRSTAAKPPASPPPSSPS